MSSERLGEHEASGVAISANKSKPKGKPSVSQADVCRHNFPLEIAQLPSSDPRSDPTGTRHRSLRSEMKFRLLQSDSIRYVNGTASSSIYLLIQSIAGTVIARASVEIKSIDAVSDWAALYRAAKSTTTVARGKLQHTSDSRAKGLMTCKRCSSANSTADWTVIRASEPAKTPGERRTG